MSRTSSERLINVQFMFCFQGVALTIKLTYITERSITLQMQDVDVVFNQVPIDNFQEKINKLIKKNNACFTIMLYLMRWNREFSNVRKMSSSRKQNNKKAYVFEGAVQSHFFSCHVYILLVLFSFLFCFMLNVVAVYFCNSNIISCVTLQFFNSVLHFE